MKKTGMEYVLSTKAAKAIYGIAILLFGLTLSACAQSVNPGETQAELQDARMKAAKERQMRRVTQAQRKAAAERYKAANPKAAAQLEEIKAALYQTAESRREELQAKSAVEQGGANE